MKSETSVAKPLGYRPLLGISNAKTSKGEKLGVITGILYLSPANESGVLNTCWGATTWCIEGCLKDSGHLAFERNRKVRIEKTLLLVNQRELFLECLRYDVAMLKQRAAKLCYCATCKSMLKKTTKTGRLRRNCRKCGTALVPVTIAVRANGTSDMPWISMWLASEFPEVQFYDYTKLAKPELRMRPNYSITYSYSGENLAESLRVLSLGVNVAVVFNTKRGQPLPESWNGYRVIDGDTHDLRFLDERGVVVGLRAKGVARKQTSPFIVVAEQFVPLSAIAAAA